jgi:hypothetical protein
MAGAQTVGQSVINELFFAFTDWMHLFDDAQPVSAKKSGAVRA